MLPQDTGVPRRISSSGALQELIISDDRSFVNRVTTSFMQSKRGYFVKSVTTSVPLVQL